MYHVTKKNGKAVDVVIKWDSVSEPLRFAEQIDNAGRKAKALRYATGEAAGTRTDSWLGAPSVAVLKERLTQGWPEGANKLQQIATRDINPMSIRRRRTRGDQGDEVDMQAVWRGDLSRAWTRTRRMTRAGTNRTVTLVCMLSDSCGVSADTLFWRGASVLKLADSLTASGYNVAILGCVTSSNAAEGSKTVNTAQFVEIKATDSPLDLSALAALTAMPGWFRTQGFSGIAAACHLADADSDSCLGFPENHKAQQYASMLGIESVIVQPNVNSKADAERWIDEVLDQIEQPAAA